MSSAIGPQFRRPLDPDLMSIRFGPKILYLRKALEPLAAAIVSRLSDLPAGGGEGNRQNAFRIAIAGAPEMVARRSLRGGIARLLTVDLYFGLNPRPLHELKVTLEARRREIPVAEPMGAMVQWLAPLVYRGFFLTRAISGQTLWELVRSDPDPHVRAVVLKEARAAIETMHSRGLLHADLNLHNLFVTRSGESFAVVILDLDKARMFDHALPAALRRRTVQRLLRSARKLDPRGEYLDSRALAILNVA